MNLAQNRVLADVFLPSQGQARLIKQALLVLAGVAAMAVAAKIKFPMWPVPATMQTFVLLTIGASYGLRLSVLTLAGYLAIGLLGFDVFASSSAANAGWAYMVGATGGYLLGFVVAAATMGALAARGWDRSFKTSLPMMLIGLAIVYGFGLSWMAYLFADTKGAAWVLQWGLINFLPFEVLKIALAAALFPTLWKWLGDLRG